MPAKEKETKHQAVRVEGETERKKALDLALAKIEHDFGKGAVMRLGDARSRMEISVLPTGILDIDVALGVGGADFVVFLGAPDVVVVWVCIPIVIGVKVFESLFDGAAGLFEFGIVFVCI